MESILYLVTAFGLGALHSLEPGHGKTIIAAYLVGSRGTAWQAILLGLVVAITHTASVLILGVISLFAASIWKDFASSNIIGIISGTIVVIIGVWMLITRWKGMVRREKHVHSHDDDNHTHNHVDEHGHSHPHHHFEHSAGQERRSLLQIFGLGISGGLVPCPAALVVLLVSLRTGEVASGMSYLLMFSLGVASVLVAIGLLVCKAAHFASRYLDKPRLAPMIAMGSAVVITGLGAFIIWQSVVS